MAEVVKSYTANLVADIADAINEDLVKGYKVKTLSLTSVVYPSTVAVQYKALVVLTRG